MGQVVYILEGKHWDPFFRSVLSCSIVWLLLEAEWYNHGVTTREV